MSHLIDELNEVETPCPICTKCARISTFVLRGPRPHKLVAATVCDHCGHSESSQSDYVTLDHAVLIKCNFDAQKDAVPMKDGANANLLRMAFVNAGAKVMVMDAEGDVLLEFASESGNVDCIQGLLLRGMEMFVYAVKDDKNKAQLESVSQRLQNILDGSAGFKLLIHDRSGYSKVCPIGLEYTDVQDWDFSRLNDACLHHRKVKKDVEVDVW